MTTKLDAIEPVSLLIILCRSRYEEVRFAGVWGLSRHLDKPRVLENLIRMLEVDPSEDVRAAAAHVLTIPDTGASIPPEEPTRPRIRRI